MFFSKPPLGTPLDWRNPLNKDLVLAYALNEGHGDVVRDLSMNGNHGTLKNFAFPPTVASGWNPGKTGVGLNFDGSSDYIDCGNNDSLRIRNAVTVSAFVRLDNDNNSAGIAGKGPATGSGYRIVIQSGTRKPYFDIKTSAGTSAIISSAAMTIGDWHYVVGVYNKDNGPNNFGIYVDGVPTSTTWTGTINDTATHMTVGLQGATYFNGILDQPRIHNRALTAKEVKDYYINPWQVYLDEDDD